MHEMKGMLEILLHTNLTHLSLRKYCQQSIPGKSTVIPVSSNTTAVLNSTIPKPVNEDVKELPFPFQLPVGFEWIFFFLIYIRSSTHFLRYFEANLDAKSTRKELHKCNTLLIKVECKILFNNTDPSVNKKGGGEQALSSGQKETKLLSKIQVILSCLHNTYDMGRELQSVRSISRQLHLVI